MPFAATWMDLEIIILNKISQRQIFYFLYVESKKKDTNELIYNTNRPTDIENKLMVTKGEGGRNKGRSLKLTLTHYYT